MSAGAAAISKRLSLFRRHEQSLGAAGEAFGVASSCRQRSEWRKGAPVPAPVGSLHPRQPVPGVPSSMSIEQRSPAKTLNLPLPQHGHWETLDCRVRSDDGQTVQDRLRDQSTVERILVMRWEAGVVRRACFVERQRL